MTKPKFHLRGTSNEIPVVSEELMAQVDRIFYHGGSRAKSHDLRFGQWLVNKIYQTAGTGINKEDVVRILFNMENPEMLELLKDYNA